ncbi:MAG TPA: dihydroneopterin aldolase [Acidimicrobiales bacterium]|nr:dihydroneopterin aldolase [Acidimicrobiales bacterium]
MTDPAPGDGDRIQLRGLRVVGTHGVLPEEKARSQPFEVDLDLSVDLTPAAGSDRLADTVDYGAVATTAAAVVSGTTSFELLETMAAAIVEATLTVDLRITAVTVHLRKLRPPLPEDIDTVGVRISRRR